MKKYILTLLLAAGSVHIASAQFFITEIIAAVINAADIAIQELQNETIILQNAQKELENVMSKLKLDEITGWVQKQKDLYQEYYQELATVKEIISGYDKVKDIVKLQARIVSEYQSSYALFKKDKHFSQRELDFMYTVYSGILDQSLKNLDQALLVVHALSTSMTDAQRMNIIDDASEKMQTNYDDLRKFNRQNIGLSLERSKTEKDMEGVKTLYGLE